MNIQGDAYARSPANDKCTMGPSAKRHLRHVTPGAATPDLRMYGCDNLPKDVRAHLLPPVMSNKDSWRDSALPDLQAAPTTTATATAPQQVQGGGKGAAAHRAVRGRRQVGEAQLQGSSSSSVAAASASAAGKDGGTAPSDNSGSDGSGGGGGSSSSSTPSNKLSYVVHEMARVKKGKGAEAAMAAGKPLAYTIRSYGLLQPADRAVSCAVRCKIMHNTSLLLLLLLCFFLGTGVVGEEPLYNERLSVFTCSRGRLDTE